MTEDNVDFMCTLFLGRAVVKLNFETSKLIPVQPLTHCHLKHQLHRPQEFPAPEDRDTAQEYKYPTVMRLEQVVRCLPHECRFSQMKRRDLWTVLFLLGRLGPLRYRILSKRRINETEIGACGRAAMCSWKVFWRICNFQSALHLNVPFIPKQP